MKFHYIAAKPDGTVTEDTAEFESAAKVIEFLAAKGLHPISIRQFRDETSLASKILRSQFSFGRITTSDKIFICRYLSLMLRAGTDLFQAIDILIIDIRKPALKSFLIEVRTALEKGQPFYTVFARYPRHFSSVFINLVKSGELSGNLEHMFNDLSISLGKEQELRNKIRSAMFYPAILLSLSLFIVLFLVTFALPRIANVFSTGNYTPPAFSRVIFGIAFFLDEYLLIVVGVLLISILGALFFFMRTRIGRNVLYWIADHIPVIRSVLHKIAIQRFAGTLSCLLRAGLPIVDALDITSITVGHPGIRQALQHIAHEGVAKGLTLGDAFRKETAFPPVVSNLIAISEKAGHLEEILHTLSEFYESEIDFSIKTLLTLIEPVLLIGIGLIVMMIALSIVVPIYQLVSQI